MTSVTLDGSTSRSSVGRWLAGVLAVAFGVATIRDGGADTTSRRAAALAEAGNIVPFVLMFNFGAGFVYVLGGLATLFRRTWAIWIARALALAVMLVFAAFATACSRAGRTCAYTGVDGPSLHSGWSGVVLPRLLAGPPCVIDGRPRALCSLARHAAHCRNGDGGVRDDRSARRTRAGGLDFADAR
ncbi:MAG: hypothetical protein IPK60_21080 [Sandaracinaceae bacterium]|nr:hypothetical protein [Sandaracinaceae bacterium]